MLSKENQLKVAGLSAVLATTLGLGGALVAPATALADVNTLQNHGANYLNHNVAPGDQKSDPGTASATTDWKWDGHKAEEVTLTDVVRLYNQWTGEHLFSTDQGEIKACEKAGWKNEGTFWKAYSHEGDWQEKFTKDTAHADQQKWGTAVYRLYNANNGEHLYTTSHEEYNNLKSIGWNGEGISFYSVNVKDDNSAVKSEDGAVNKTPQGVYRAFNKYVTVGTHNFGGYEENATMLANGWLPDNVVDGKQLPLFMVYDLDHTVNESKIAQALTRISKEYKANLEKYKALKKELVDALLAAKYDGKTEIDNLEKISGVTASLQQQLKDADQYLTKLQYQAQQILDDLEGKYGKDGSEAKSKAFEALFEKDNYTKLKSTGYANAVTALSDAKVELSTRNGKLLEEQGKLLGAKGALEMKTALYNDAKKAYDAAPEGDPQGLKDKMNTAKGEVTRAQEAVDTQQKTVNTAQDNVDEQKKVVDKAAAKVKKLSEQLKTFKNLFQENVKKFQDYRHSQDLKKSQALRDVEAYAKYAMVYGDLKSDLTALAKKESDLMTNLKDNNNGIVATYNKAIKKAATDMETTGKLPDLSGLKATLESALDEFFLNVVPGDDEFKF